VEEAHVHGVGRVARLQIADIGRDALQGHALLRAMRGIECSVDGKSLEPAPVGLRDRLLRGRRPAGSRPGLVEQPSLLPGSAPELAVERWPLGDGEAACRLADPDGRIEEQVDRQRGLQPLRLSRALASCALDLVADPIRKATDFAVAKGLAGLSLLGDDVRDDVVLAGAVQLVFVRPG
jgi:hypothetical protein